jgi:hypothetical protein
VAESGPTYISLEWSASSDTELPVLGYSLSMMDNSLGTDVYEEVYYGFNYPNVLKYMISSQVQTGMTYTFKVQALNYNGAGTASSAVAYTVCTVPVNLFPPNMTAVTETTMTLSWVPPESDGGCQVLSYSIVMDDGAGGSLTEIDASDVNLKPTLRTHTIDSFSAADTSKTFVFQLQATNSIGTTSSIEVSHVLAAVPDMPASAPTLNLEGTSTSTIHVDYSEFTTSMNGGSDILSYELQIYDYTTSTWLSIVGHEGDFTIAASFTAQNDFIEKGRAYMFRYRAWNVNGAGEWSEVSYLVAASTPARPPTPEYGSSTDSSITLLFAPSSDDGGKIITSMELQASPHLVTSWSDLTNYDGMSMSYTVTVANDGVVAFNHYRFRIRVVNEYGNSEYSEEVVLSVAPLPSKLEAVTKVQGYSSDGSTMVRWADPGLDTEPILGYRLLLTDQATEERTVIYDAPTNPNVFEFLATGLVKGRSYGYEVLAINFNGAGEEWSDVASFRTCTVPVEVPIPGVTEQSATQLSF